MLIQPHDRDDDPARWRAFVVAQGFGHLIASGAGRDVPVAVPTQYVLGEDEVILHLAAPNPILPALVENPKALLSVAGDWAFIPGAWKAIDDEDPARGIPTTYYGAVQITGTCTVVDDADGIAEILRRQTGTIDPDGTYVDPLDHGAKLRAIRGIRLSIGEVRAKFKYGGNVDEAHRAAVADRLRDRGGPGDQAALQHLSGSRRS
jgi:transcriptional regulator